MRTRFRRSSPEARADDLDYVFVVTFGRSGSTLVQGLLNVMPRTLVRGENGFYVVHLFRAAHVAEELRAKRADGKLVNRPISAFYGIRAQRHERFVGSARRLLLANLLGRTKASEIDRLGFKEVDWHQIAPEETEAFFAWFEEVFPGARYVLNTRDLEAALGSGFWKRRDRDTGVAAMERVIEIHDFLERTRPDRVVRTRYEDITSDDAAVSEGALRALAEFVLGTADDGLVARLRKELGTTYGPNPTGTDGKAGAKLPGRSTA